MTISAMKQALEALEKLWDIIDDIDTYGDMAKSDDKLYRSLVERRQRQRFEQTGISTDGYELNGEAITTLRQAIEQAEKQEGWVLREVYFSEGEPISHREPQWVGLTDEEINEAQDTAAVEFKKNKYRIRGQMIMPGDSPDWWFARAIEAKLKEKNT